MSDVASVKLPTQSQVANGNLKVPDLESCVFKHGIHGCTPLVQSVNKVSMARHSKVSVRTDAQIHKQYVNITFLHMGAVKIRKSALKKGVAR